MSRHVPLPLNQAGVGVSVVSRRGVDEDCRPGALTCLGLAELPNRRAFHVVSHRERSHSPLAEPCRVFLECEVG